MITANKVYAAEYNSCIYESDYGMLSLHYTYQGASQAVRNHEMQTLNDWKQVGHDEIPSYEKWRVREIEVQA